MGKELIISANRHETKVAVLEDDQLVEIYFQRSNEYSLAGSIHKGRVTRVLPGMQSAFVDIGLDRDAFLYVSDFFEDNEEYDRIASAAEEKALKAEREARTAPVYQEPAPAPAPPPVVVPVAAPVPAENSVAPPERPHTPYERPDENDRDRRGRRSRRRRTRGGRGFPESKYASLRETAPRIEQEEDARPETSAGEFALLPGENLAKYSRSPYASDAEFAIESQAEPDSGAAQVEPDERIETAAYNQAAEDVEQETVDSILAMAPPPGEEPAEPADTVQEVSEPLRAGPVADEDLLNTVVASAPDNGPWAASDAAREPFEPATDPESAAVADSEAAEPAGDSESEPPSGVAVEESLQEESFVVEEPAGGVPGEEEPSASGEAGADEVEPARMPVSLTATLREQGHRYNLNRVSRRMRRRMRNTGQSPEAAVEAAPEPPAIVEEVPEARPDGRTARPERRERQERPERTERERPPLPSITELLEEGQEILVQIAKEPLGQKGARITSHIALPGRYVVYMPTVEHLGVSRKIATDEERLRLKRILQSHRTGIPGGFIVRTAGEGKSEAEIAADMRFLFNLWLDIRQKAEARKAPALIHHDLDLVSRILRDQMTDTFKTVWVDNEEVYESVLGFVQRFQPGLVGRVKLYTRDAPIFDSFNISSELEKALRPKVWLKSGGYIVINQTEALVAIDVNTGKFVGKSNRLEDTIVKTNTEAVKEIVRQIRLRDLGGIIVVDFIDMDERKNRQKVMQVLEETMRADRAPNKILQFNDFGLVAITRKRVKQSLERTLCAPCPYCEGAGYVKSAQTVIGEVLQEAHKIRRAVQGSKDCTLRVNPEVARILKSNDNDFIDEIEEILGRPVLVVSDALLQQEKFDLV